MEEKLMLLHIQIDFFSSHRKINTQTFLMTSISVEWHRNRYEFDALIVGNNHYINLLCAVLIVQLIIVLSSQYKKYTEALLKVEMISGEILRLEFLYSSKIIRNICIIHTILSVTVSCCLRHFSFPLLIFKDQTLFGY